MSAERFGRTARRWAWAFWWLVAVAIVFAAGGVALGVWLIVQLPPDELVPFYVPQGMYHARSPAPRHPHLDVGVAVLVGGVLAGSAFGVIAMTYRRMLDAMSVGDR